MYMQTVCWLNIDVKWTQNKQEGQIFGPADRGSVFIRFHWCEISSRYGRERDVHSCVSVSKIDRKVGTNTNLESMKYVLRYLLYVECKKSVEMFETTRVTTQVTVGVYSLRAILQLAK